MRILEGPPHSWPAVRRGAAVTIGVYDGVHLGHQHVIGRLGQAADRRDLDVTVVTFRQHPAAVLAPERLPPQLTTLDQRLDLFAQLGVDQVALLDFDEELRMQPPERFVEQVLVEGVGARYVSVGRGFRFGHAQAGDIDLLAELGRSAGFEVDSVELIGAGAPFSATRIRQALAAGDLATAEQQLGRRFAVCGTVTRGDGRGRTIGVPTANLDLAEHQALPQNGVYAVVTETDDGSHPAVANIGVRPTFGGAASPLLEVHLLDVELDLYGRTLCVEFVSRIRDERRFDGVDQLIDQIGADIATARAML